MPILDNEFKCPNGHVFRANAKIRARCSQCGSMAKRDFLPAPKPVEPVKSPEGSPAGKQEPVKTEPHKQVRIIRQGKVMPPKSTPKRTVHKPVVPKPKTTGRVANGLVKTIRAKKPSIPTVNRRPKRTAVAGQLKNNPPGRNRTFADDVIDAFKFW